MMQPESRNWLFTKRISLTRGRVLGGHMAIAFPLHFKLICKGTFNRCNVDLIVEKVYLPGIHNHAQAQIQNQV
jgi:hypothetical protein